MASPDESGREPPFDRMECGHSARYRYDRSHDPDNPCEGDRAESWGCSVCDVRRLRRVCTMLVLCHGVSF